jgi:pimeloyl-[acyl-carrier protein] methyl ester esterase
MAEESPPRRLVLLPGVHGTGDLFGPLVEALAPSLEPIVVSYPRDRELTAAELVEFARSHLPLGHPYVLLGESFSSLIAIQIAAAHPASLRALVLSAGFASSPVRGPVRVASRILTAPLLRLLSSSDRTLRLPSFLVRRFFTGPSAPRPLVEAVQSTVASVHTGVLTSRLQYIYKCSVRAELARVAVPLLYLQATEDRVVPARCLDEILAIKPGAVAIRIESPHLILQCEPQKSAEAIARFIEHLGRSAGSQAI